MYYEVHGEGYPLIMINGYSGTSQGWNNIVPILDDLSKHYKTIAFDNRGIGGSSAPPGEYSIRKMADDIAGLLDALKVPIAHILGASMGGMIAQELAINYPEKVKGLVLICTSPGGPVFDSVKGLREATSKLSWSYSPPPGMTPGAVLAQMLTMIYRPKFLEDNMAKIMSSMKGMIPASTLGRHFDAIMKFNAYPRLRMIHSKTLVIHGACDGLIMPECGEILAGSILDSRLLMCEDASHMVFVEKWGEVKPAILDFLSEV
jgi:3-oxoadipate enol-lactonase